MLLGSGLLGLPLSSQTAKVMEDGTSLSAGSTLLSVQDILVYLCLDPVKTVRGNR